MNKLHTTYLLATFSLVILASATTHNALTSPRQDNSWQGPPGIQLSGPADQDDPHDYVPEYYSAIRVIHAALMSAVWLVLFPVGAVIIRVLPRDHPYLVAIHAGIQMVAFWIFVAAAGMGIWMAKEIEQLHNYHPVIGLILLALLALQPATEILNHRLYHRHPGVIVAAHIHLWLGRGLLAAGVIQGGLGFVFAASFPKAVVEAWPRVAYGAAALLTYVIYLAVGIIWPEVRKQGNKKKDKQENEEVSRVEGGMCGVGDARNGMSMDMVGRSVDHVHSHGGDLTDFVDGHGYGYSYGSREASRS